MPTFEVYFEDLIPEAQQRYLEWIKIEKHDDEEYRYIPIRLINQPITIIEDKGM